MGIKEFRKKKNYPSRSTGSVSRSDGNSRSSSNDSGGGSGGGSGDDVARHRPRSGSGSGRDSVSGSGDGSGNGNGKDSSSESRDRSRDTTKGGDRTRQDRRIRNVTPARATPTSETVKRAPLNGKDGGSNSQRDSAAEVIHIHTSIHTYS